MSTYVLMRILESSPQRYDLGIRLLTLGRLDKAYDRLVAHIEDGQRVLDIGCGTAALALRAAQRGAAVKGIDINAQMLEIARRRVASAGLSEAVQLVESGVAELDAEEGRCYDAVMSSLCLSELSTDELHYCLAQAARILRPGGLLLVADEIRPQNPIKQLLYVLLRWPLVALTYLLTQQTTHPASKLDGKLTAAGFVIEDMRRNWLGSFGEFVARKPAETGR